jgi:hypothetical protein
MDVKEIVYFNKSDRMNTDKIMSFAHKKIEESGIRSAVIVYSSGYTLKKFQEVIKKANLALNIVVVTNAKGAKMPIIIGPNDDAETRKWKEEQLNKGITGIPLSISDETLEELEKEGIKVYYVPDYLGFGEPLALTDDGRLKREKLAPFMLNDNLRPLDIDVGVDLSLLTIISQGFRVCVGCTVLAVKAGLIKEGETVFALGGRATALILRASSEAKTCLVREIIGYERGSSWDERDLGKEMPGRD